MLKSDDPNYYAHNYNNIGHEKKKNKNSWFYIIVLMRIKVRIIWFKYHFNDIITPFVSDINVNAKIWK